jgi:hypothetical protein
MFIFYFVERLFITKTWLRKRPTEYRGLNYGREDNRVDWAIYIMTGHMVIRY